ncbi:efflux RND transporter periplasmic adaptor subunit [Formosa sediminum]|uniref:Efflux RND transporter periplasmic adaptor subunit n=1 Tax=Formosa sediminum TaxID=2594004 RepID=A0A516GS96_9FLAO|nr:efflux RND transporter periplasmic adaptor subunit [Formosa sediminum]QDO94392.1 efflux RND transporter periplasmic adaptor subunit [Formosa sediminum]
MNTKKILWICLAILGLGILITVLIFSTEPEAEQEGASLETAILVDVEVVKKGTFHPTIVATGTVQAVEDVNLSSLVSGQVIQRDARFTPGGFVKKNEVLLQIDPSDYRNTLALRKSELMQIQTTLHTEMGRQQIAEQDLQFIAEDSLFGDQPLSEEERQLILRKPQLDAVEANISAAQASVNQAQLNLERTTIRAPFDAHILSQNVTTGSLVAQGDVLGRLVGIDHYWVMATVPVSQLKWLRFPSDKNEVGALVKIEHASAWAQGAYREGYLDTQIGALEGQTRLARVLVKVKDPLALTPELKGKPQLMLGTFVDVSIKANPVDDVVKLKRDYVRGKETVWVMKNDSLQIRAVDIVLTDDTHAYIRSGLEHNDQVVITDLSTVSEGIALRTRTTPQKNH